MPFHHALVFVDHHCAKIIAIGSEQAHERKVNAHLHLSGHNERSERSKHEFFGKVCDALDGIAEVLVVGGHMGVADFRHYVEKHRPLTGERIDGYEVVDHPSDNALVAQARQWFSHRTRMVGVAA